MTKLTLSVDEQVVAEAKRIARSRNTSVSAMFANLIRGMTTHEKAGKGVGPPVPARGPLTDRALHLTTRPIRRSADDLRQEALFEKHGLRT